MAAHNEGPVVNDANTWAGRGAVKVTTASAFATSPLTSPSESASAPEGMSTAMTGTRRSIDCLDDRRVKPFNRRTKPRPQNRIHHQFRLNDALGVNIVQIVGVSRQDDTAIPIS